jgi:hypothetical protein
MASFVVLVLDKPDLLHLVLQAWRDAGAGSATVLESMGSHKMIRLFCRDDMPLFPSLHNLAEDREHTNRTIFSFVDSDAVVERMIAATEGVVGDLSQSDTGILIVLPVARVVGGQRGERV